MLVREFIIEHRIKSNKILDSEWILILKDKANTLLELSFGNLGARQSVKHILTENLGTKTSYLGKKTYYSDMDEKNDITRIKVDFKNKNKIIVNFKPGYNNGLGTTLFYNVNPILYKNILEYLNQLPIGEKKTYNSINYDNHLKEVKLDQTYVVAAAAIGESFFGPAVGSQIRSFLSPNRVGSENLKPWRLRLLATQKNRNARKRKNNSRNNINNNNSKII
jgi:hypothetical protein